MIPADGDLPRVFFDKIAGVIEGSGHIRGVGMVIFDTLLLMQWFLLFFKVEL